MKEIITAGLLFVAAPIEAITTDKPTYSPSEHIQCLAMNMYHEARDQGTAGKLAVSAVVLNRVNDERFPNSVCEVVLRDFKLDHPGETEPLSPSETNVSSLGIVMANLMK